MCAFLYCRIIVYDEPMPDCNAFVVVVWYHWNYEVFFPSHYYYVTKQPGSITGLVWYVCCSSDHMWTYAESNE